MIDVVTISSKGQVVIPKKLREEAGFAEQDKVLIMGADGKIVLEKVKKDEARRRLARLIQVVGDRYAKLGITEEEIQNEVNAVRNEKNKNSVRH